MTINKYEFWGIFALIFLAFTLLIWNHQAIENRFDVACGTTSAESE